MIKAVIFDLDDTLYPEESFQTSGFRFIANYLGEKGFPVTEATIRETYAAHPKNAFNVLIGQYNIPMTPQELVALFREHVPTIELYPGVIEMLDTLKQKYILGMITDYHHDTQRKKLAALGIEPYFDHIIFSTERGKQKPDVTLFEEMKRLTGANTGEIVYVGDNEVKDFIGARQAGYRTIKYKSGGVYKDVEAADSHKAEFEIDKLELIAGLISSL